MAVQSVRRWEKGEEKGWEKSLRDDRQLMIDTSACRDKTTIKHRQSRKLEKKKKTTVRRRTEDVLLRKKQRATSVQRQCGNNIAYHVIEKTVFVRLLMSI